MFFHSQLPAWRERIQAGMLHAVLPHPDHTAEWAAGIQKMETGMWKGTARGQRNHKRGTICGCRGWTTAFKGKDCPALFSVPVQKKENASAYVLIQEKG